VVVRIDKDFARDRLQFGHTLAVVVVVAAVGLVELGCGFVAEVVELGVVQWPVVGGRRGLLDRKVNSRRLRLARAELYLAVLPMRSVQVNLGSTD
jgi:hypothetical protein